MNRRISGAACALLAMSVMMLGGCASTNEQTAGMMSNVGVALDSMTRAVADLGVVVENDKYNAIAAKIDEGNSYVQDAIPKIQESLALDGTIDPQAAGAAAGGIANMIVPGSGGLAGGLAIALMTFLNGQKTKKALKQTVRGVENFKSNGAQAAEVASLHAHLGTVMDKKTRDIVRNIRED